MRIDRQSITGLILCGGLGTRMAGADKGLQPYHGVPLALHVLRRLTPQVGSVIINANRNLPAYAAMGVPVWPDSQPGFLGPLAGWQTGLEQCRTGYLLALPCDSPDFPADLAERLAEGLEREAADLAIAAIRDETGTVRRQPVFCLMKASLRDDLSAAVRAGERKVGRWATQQRCAIVLFDDADAFGNANTQQELDRLQGIAARPG